MGALNAAGSRQQQKQSSDLAASPQLKNSDQFVYFCCVFPLFLFV
jgi:hypothetical protein